jgi:hypothetical protein
MGVSNNKNVLFLSYDGMTDPLGQSQVIPYLQGLSKAGYSFTLISFEKPERFEKLSHTISQILKSDNIEWVPLPYTKKPPVFSTIWDLSRMKKKAYDLHRKKKFSIVHCRSYISALVGLEMKQKLGVKFIFDMRGFYADERLDGGIWSLSNPIYRAIYRFFKQKEKEFLSKADYTISLTQKAKDIIHTWQDIPGQPVPIQVIPCCADLQLFSEANIDVNLFESLKTQFNFTGNEFVLGYLGSIGTWYMLDEMLDFFVCLLKKRADAKFLFITAESPAGIIEKAKQRNIPEGALVITTAIHKQVPTYLALANWSIFFIKPVFSKSASSPTKQGEIMGMEMPHVCNSGVGDIDAIIDKRSGVVVHQFNKAAYEEAVTQMLNTIPDKKYIRSKAEEFYSLAGGVNKYRLVYGKVLG